MAKEKLQYGRIYHIYNRGNNGENLFVERRNYPYFLQLYAKHIQPVAETYAYSLLPNHFHFALRTRTEEKQEAYYDIETRCWHGITAVPTSSTPTPPNQTPGSSRPYY